MTGRRLVDLITLVNVSSSIARGHFLIRSQQLNVYATSSSVLKSFRPRPPIGSSQTPQASARPDGASVAPLKEGIKQDHFYTPEASATVDPEPRSDLHVTQKKADQYPPPDRTISPSNISKTEKSSLGSSAASKPTRSRPPPEEAKRLQYASESSIPEMTADPPGEDAVLGTGTDVFYLRQARVSSVLSNLPRKKIPRQTEGEQAPTSAGRINGDVFYETPGQIRDAERGVVPEKEDGELNSGLFRSRRSKTILSQSTTQSEELKPKAAATPKDTTGLNGSKDQAKFHETPSAEISSELPRNVGERTKTIVEQASSSEMCALSLLLLHSLYY
ncbi:hypothetical protein Q9L58_003991 [Maublancomyces gigas]|uniref:Uncharacterized protein n=1 Tax=Discina gigas TaxID=1032678 RepID=A0ABR3GM69_9PEZI